MVYNLPPNRERKPPPRPKTPKHPIPRERPALTSPPTQSPCKPPLKSSRSALDVARRGLDLSKAAIEKAAVGAATHINRIATNTFKPNEKEKKNMNEAKCQLSRLPSYASASSASSSSSSSTSKSLYHRRRLPKLQIPDVGRAVHEALGNPCETATPDSPTFPLLEISPTSKYFKDEWQDDDNTEDVRAEFHNMLSARRRVRKGKFGAEVTRYCLARPSWKGSWVCRTPNDNREDRELLKMLTEALQQQKDYATKLVQKNPHFPRFDAVSSPGCTLKMYCDSKRA
ncbi:hypothetical protein F5Y09DRAFT_341774 [Xylaria sp. FL1042]|nr:hypothetical protein F5Y09DRAFT_341774 [Xylaria sp. FL1042]